MAIMTITYFSNGFKKIIIRNDYYDHCDSLEEWLDNNDRLHRLDGPARIWSYRDIGTYKDNNFLGGKKYIVHNWYWYGKKIECSSQKEFEKFLKLKVFL